MSEHEWLQQAVDLAVANVANGGGPFGAVVVKDGDVVATGQNRVTADLDPTAHAEVQAIRAAAKVIGDFSLAGCVLCSSCEPCPMCLASALWARVDRVAYAATRDDAAAGGFDDREFYGLFARDRSTWTTEVGVVPLDDATAPFDAWAAYADRVDY
ncbi:tRNA(Arg) A34 adenosine deaminase TadA [Nocardioides terrae]|uniref:tRNA(Arg) A34 adenosine deaminase TadA n=1 Tax=Nocardioides terrae TaxID=574651 RepID=A0A1I1DYH7_9ACTN|nr:nucleoside deaminase [Nocardioides terrae]SFB77770.1 tRNA(Arg) A34 adenosine deaminase TadA [Nocardioides terrae]